MPITLICEYDGRIFQVPPSQLPARFCSRACYWASMRAQLIDVVCAGCGNPDRVQPHRVRYGRFFCNTDCYEALLDAPLPVWHTDPETRGYCAAMIDGEGHISLNKSKTRAPWAYVGIFNTDERLMSYLQRSFAGHATIKRHSQPTSRHKTVLGFIVRGRHALQFLQPLLPALQLKRRQAELLLEFYELPWVERRWSAKGEIYWQQIKALNCRGPQPTTTPSS